MEEEILQVYSNAEIILIEGSGGVFELMLENTILFSKKENIGTLSIRFPHADEAVMLIKEALA